MQPTPVALLHGVFDSFCISAADNSILLSILHGSVQAVVAGSKDDLLVRDKVVLVEVLHPRWNVPVLIAIRELIYVMRFCLIEL